ncbi:MAG: DUF952 domain-containing protein [Pseudomonadota bacterium]|nr:DUF952 domain-containing protein [Pseudomonadota bacterium]
MSLVYKVVGRDDWAAAEREGVFHGAAIDLKDGYIHLSAADQVAKTVALYFAERDDLLLVALDAEAFPALKWEPSRGGAPFPHLYASLPLDRVAWARPFSSRDPQALAALIAA